MFDRIRLLKHNPNGKPRLYILDYGSHKTVIDLYKCIGIKKPYCNEVSVKHFGSGDIYTCSPSEKLLSGDTVYYYDKPVDKPSNTELLELMRSGPYELRNVKCKHKTKRERKWEFDDIKAQRKQAKARHRIDDIDIKSAKKKKKAYKKAGKRGCVIM